ncbi:hypothetical protein Bca4012_045438 [Brassica carinata]|uniref:(rape) hypothetical protein n=1 Tax=Brassica napus TaxID=3708 RepID=A0A816J7G0_BRANA|nr:uncharacterized protein LOC106399801 [Brassica napus]CAF1772203.1 unnamed protein product [Brassica napus]
MSETDLDPLCEAVQHHSPRQIESNTIFVSSDLLFIGSRVKRFGLCQCEWTDLHLQQSMAVELLFLSFACCNRVYGPSLSLPLSSSDELSDVSAKLGSSQSDPTSSQGRR